MPRNVTQRPRSSLPHARVELLQTLNKTVERPAVHHSLQDPGCQVEDHYTQGRQLADKNATAASSPRTGRYSVAFSSTNRT